MVDVEAKGTASNQHCGAVIHGEDVSVTLRNWQRANQIQMNV